MVRRLEWFSAAKALLSPAIDVRNQANKAAFSVNPSIEAKKVLTAARKRVKRDVQKAKQSWMELTVATINKESATDRRIVNPQDVWTAIRALEHGSRTAKNLDPIALRKNQAAGGATEVCETPEENAKVMVGSLEKNIFVNE